MLDYFHVTTKMEDNLNQNGRRPQPKWKMTLTKMKDDLTQNGSRPEIKDDQKCKTTQNLDDQNMKTNKK